MKIAIVGYFGWYGSMAEWVADAWEDNGHEVYRMDRTGADFKYLYLNTYEVDIILFVDCSEDFSVNINWNELTPSNPVKIFWSMDAHMPGGAERSVNIARKCDLVFSSNYEHGVKILEKFGVESYLLPVTYSERLVNQSLYPKDEHLVTMIGHANSPERIQLWNILKQYKSFTGVAAKSSDYFVEMEKCKIVVNQPTEPWDIILNNRFFEGLAFSKLVLQKRLKTNLIEKLGFVDGVHFKYWDNFEELETLINNYDDKEDWLIGQNGASQVQQYSMRAQCSKMESVILTKFYDRL